MATSFGNRERTETTIGVPGSAEHKGFMKIAPGMGCLVSDLAGLLALTIAAPLPLQGSE
jgi:hypothetical protein